MSYGTVDSSCWMEIQVPDLCIPEVVAVIDMGLPGPPGPAGATGATGPAGTRGGIWLVEPREPSSGEIASMMPGDAFLNGITGDIYQIDSMGRPVLDGNIMGPTGPGRVGEAYYTHEQNLTSDTWIIEHNLGYVPNVHVADNGGIDMVGNIEHPSTMTTIIRFSVPVAGTAYFS